MPYLQMRKQIGALLADLGPSSPEVAMRLGDSGVRGTPKDVHGCAIAAYLNAILGTEAQIRSVKVFRTSVRVLAGRPRIRISVGLPCAVQRFIEDFDKRRYPELIRDYPYKPDRAGF